MRVCLSFRFALCFSITDCVLALFAPLHTETAHVAQRHCRYYHIILLPKQLRTLIVTAASPWHLEIPSFWGNFWCFWMTFNFGIFCFHLAHLTLCYASLFLLSISTSRQPQLKRIIVMGFIIAAAVIRPDANLAFRKSVPSSLCLFDRQGQCEIDEEYKDSEARTTRAQSCTAQWSSAHKCLPVASAITNRRMLKSSEYK